VGDLRKMAISVNKEPLYVIVYGSGSEVMHASNYGPHIRFQNKRVTFLSIRHPKEFSTLIRLTATIAMDVFMRILDVYREGERSRFGQKYLERWQRAFMNIPELKIVERDIGDR
jgi:hypothetical protein